MSETREDRGLAEVLDWLGQAEAIIGVAPEISPSCCANDSEPGTWAHCCLVTSVNGAIETLIHETR